MRNDSELDVGIRHEIAVRLIPVGNCVESAGAAGAEASQAVDRHRHEGAGGIVDSLRTAGSQPVGKCEKGSRCYRSERPEDGKGFGKRRARWISLLLSADFNFSVVHVVLLSRWGRGTKKGRGAG